MGVGGRTAWPFARDKGRRLVVEKEEKSSLQLRRFAEATHGSSGEDLARSCCGGAVIVPKQFCVLLGGEEAGGNGVDADADAREVHGKPLGEVRNCRLGARICGDLGQGSIGVHRGDVENGAALSAHHLTGERLGGNEGTEEVEVEDEANAVSIEIKEALGISVDIAKLKILLVGGRTGVRRRNPNEKSIINFHGNRNVCHNVQLFYSSIC